MKAIKKSIQILTRAIVILIGLYAIEVALFPKKVINIKTNQETFEVLDVHFKLRANKLAIGRNKESNGWYVSENEPQKIDKKILDKEVFLQIDENEFTLVEDKFIANKLYLVNNSSKEICLPAQDSRLNLKMQAKNIFGSWSDIEYIPNSWCGNSYHEICIEHGELWEFPSLQFKGRHKTKFRYKLEYGENELISNEIEGYVNNGQFINKQKYFPIDLTDPYNE